LALSVPLSRFTPQVGGGSAFFVRHHSHAMKQKPPSVHFGFTGEIFGGTILGIGLGIMFTIGYIKFSDSQISLSPLVRICSFVFVIAGSFIARSARLKRLSQIEDDSHDA
jgi:hypothetical protein